VHALLDVMPGLDERDIFRSIAGPYPAAELAAKARVVCFRGEGFPRVDDVTGYILCPDRYTTAHEPLIVYLDMVHELVHTRQVLEGRPVYHFPKPYVEWPTEIEAYRITYEEAHRLGVPDAWFWDYLSVPWVNDADLLRLGRSIGMPAPRGRPDESMAHGARR
jgi:hypothetical protein